MKIACNVGTSSLTLIHVPSRELSLNSNKDDCQLSTASSQAVDVMATSEPSLV